MRCRICNRDMGDSVFSLGNQPISNNYISMDCKECVTYPLDLYFCDECLFMQIDEVVMAKDIFCEDYPYVSSASNSWLEHCEDYASKIINRMGLTSNSNVLEIASNDGYLLQYFKQNGIGVKGVEPSRGVAEIAINNGIDTDVEFFDIFYALKMMDKRYEPDLIIANNVIAHNPKVIDFVEGVSMVLKEDGVFTVEFPHLSNLLKYKQFDTIYHEHYSYFSLNSINILFNKCGLTIFDVERLPTHGGSLRVYAQHSRNFKYSVNTPQITDVLQEEEGNGVYSRNTYNKFDKSLTKIKNDTLRFLRDAKEDGKRVVGYGAPAKGNTFLNYCGIDESLIEYTVDRSEYKTGKRLPGSNIPIYHVAQIVEDSPDYIFILPWNIRDEIVSFLGKDKAKFVTAIPTLEII